jgi:hypothetical protein
MLWNALRAADWRRLMVSPLLLAGVLLGTWLIGTAPGDEPPPQDAEIPKPRQLPAMRARIKSGVGAPLAGFVSAGEPVAGDVGIRPPAPGPEVSFSDEDFDELVFGKEVTVDETCARLEALLREKIEAIDRACELNAPQKEKLRLAGRGSIQRCIDRVEELRARFRLVTDSNTARDLAVDAAPLRFLLTFGPFGDRSLFGKTLRRILTAEQTAKYEPVK